MHSMIITVVTTMTQAAEPVFLGFSAPAMKTPETPPAFGFGILLALHLPGDEVAFVITHFTLNLLTLLQEKLNLSPMEVAAYEEVSNYLAGIATLDQCPYSWISGAPTLSSEGQTALTIALSGLTLELTGAKLANFKLPGGKMRTEVVTYLALIQVSRQQYLVDCPKISFLFPTQNIVDAMAGSKNWEAAPKDYNLDKMHTDITKMVTNF